MRCKTLVLVALIVLISSVPAVADITGLTANAYLWSGSNNESATQQQTVQSNPSGAVYFKDNGSLYALYPNGSRVYVGSLVSGTETTGTPTPSPTEEFNQTAANERFQRALSNLTDGGGDIGGVTNWFFISIALFGGLFIFGTAMRIVGLEFPVLNILEALLRLLGWIIRTIISLLLIMLGREPLSGEDQETPPQPAPQRQAATDTPIQFTCRSCNKPFHMTQMAIKDREETIPGTLGLCDDCAGVYEPLNLNEVAAHASLPRRRLEFKEEKEPEKSKSRGAYLEWRE